MRIGKIQCVLLRRRKRTIAFAITCVAAGFLYYVLATPEEFFDLVTQLNEYVSGIKSEDPSTYHNLRSSFVVNTSTCKIPDFDPWDKDTRFIRLTCPWLMDDPEPGCRKKSKLWMYSHKNELVVNYTSLHESGYSWNSIYCCYQSISRVEQSKLKYDMNADKVAKYSSECFHLNQTRTFINVEFIRVVCKVITWPYLNDVVYTGFFTFPQPDETTKRKILEWHSRVNVTQPPNVVIIMLDATSRLNMRRRLPKTLKTLKSIGAVELFGHTKVGENTFPNQEAFLGGLTSICDWYDRPFDDCPLIWKDFHRAGYLTVFAEDIPTACAFNYHRMGFVRKPTDFYYRPFTLLALNKYRHWNSIRDGNFVKCIGPYYSEEMQLKYVADLMNISGPPLFIYNVASVNSHECSNSVRFGDSFYANFIEKMDLSNTVLFFMSDHGDRHGRFRETTLGWYEDKLPAVWIHLPTSFRNKYPHWIESLQVNSRRLTNHFDIYWTLVQILETFRHNESFGVNTPPSRGLAKLGQSLFTPVPKDRTCKQAGISAGYCACEEPAAMDLSNEDIPRAVQSAIRFINNNVPKQCSQVSLKNIVRAKLLRQSHTAAIFIVTFYTEPGDFLFEATVQERKVFGRFEKAFTIDSFNDILRVNKFERKVDCVKNAVLERFCYCI